MLRLSRRSRSRTKTAGRRRLRPNAWLRPIFVPAAVLSPDAASPMNNAFVRRSAPRPVDQLDGLSILPAKISRKKISTDLFRLEAEESRHRRHWRAVVGGRARAFRNRYMSVCFSILETEGCLIFNAAAISACALPAALRSSRRLSTSSLSSRYRASMRLRRCFGKAPIISPSVRPMRFILSSPKFFSVGPNARCSVCPPSR
jgi:hypothetical protein